MTATKKPQPHRCGVCHGCKGELRKATQGTVMMCANTNCDRVFTAAHMNLHGYSDSPYRGRCPKVTR